MHNHGSDIRGGPAMSDEKIIMKWIGELHPTVGQRWITNYAREHGIPDLAFELLEDRLIAHAVIVEAQRWYA